MLPDVGEGLTEADILLWHVEVGDSVELDQTIVEIETAKSVVDLPSPVSGTVVELGAAAGATIVVGALLIRLEEKSAAVPTESELIAPVAGEPVPGPPGPKVQAREPVLVGYGVTDDRARRRHIRLDRDDGVRRAARPPIHPGLVHTNGQAAIGAEPELRTPIKGVRRAMADAMVHSAFTAPHVTEWLDADVTETMSLVRRLRADRRWAHLRITPLVVVARALLSAIRRNPQINTSWDEEAQEIVQLARVNLGVAAATPRGLVVPNIKSADLLSFTELTVALADLISTAREGRVPPADMRDGTITITNIGSLGVVGGTPILNPGEAAILAVGAIRQMPWVVDERIEIRDVVQLALSFDHRLVDGALGGKILTDIREYLEDPATAIALE
ncbi:dihydrolipoamide acetyltransferase family protein [Nocardioides jensenii]|uniref:dihydrolipoamide acetyltransferase family protein n=1 Tax=Nocardioides jensenii TaxID=1843 RepID=UPI00157AEA71|nr:dihydrolipoamide acetyltransferase family protein [Nocardioides jensenii]